MSNPNATPLRYVILHHTGIPAPHYDLMFERHPGGPLITFRSPAWPLTTDGPVQPLDDHRRDYLDYEGPVSNNRGVVRRVQAGTYEGKLSLGLMTSNDVTLLTPERVALRIRAIIDADWIIEPRQPESPDQQ